MGDLATIQRIIITPADESEEKSVILYHATTDEAAWLILRDGFRDPDPEHPRIKFHGGTGIWLADYPPNSICDFAQGDVLLEVTLDCDESDLAKWDESINPEPGDLEWDPSQNSVTKWPSGWQPSEVWTIELLDSE